MTSKMTKLVVLSIAIVALLTQAAVADVLHDQSDFDAAAPGYFNSVSGGPPFGMTNYVVNHVTVVGGGWLVDSISTYYSALDPGWGDAITTGHLHVFTKTGVLPMDGTDDPTLSTSVAMTGMLDGDHIVVTASGLNLELEPGEYWIGITPVAPGGMWGPEIHLSSMSLMGDASASYDQYAFPGPPAWFNFNPGVDASLLIEGDGSVVASETTSFGNVKSLFR